MCSSSLDLFKLQEFFLSVRVPDSSLTLQLRAEKCRLFLSPFGFKAVILLLLTFC